MARILRGVKSPFAPVAGGGGCLAVWWCPCVPVSIPAACVPCSLPAVSPSCGVPMQSPCRRGPSFMAFRPPVGLPAFLGLSFALYGLFSCRVVLGIGSGVEMSLRGFYGALLACYSFRLRAVSTCKEKKAPFCPSFALFALLACSLSLLALLLFAYTRKAARFVGRSFSLGGAWFLLSEHEHGKRCGLSAVYLYFVGLVVGFNPSGGWACNIIKIRLVGCIGAACTMVYCYSLCHILLF